MVIICRCQLVLTKISVRSQHALYELARHPKALQKLRKEHTGILGQDNSEYGSRLLQRRIVLNDMPYTTATIKETIRLYSPIGSTRLGEKDFSIKHNGQFFSTEGCMVFIASPALHHDAALYPSPSEFRPERFLPDALPQLPKHAYRPFEIGPRSCLGRELAMLEIKVLLVLLVGTFDFEPNYHGESTVENCVEGYGERAYQTMYTTAKPKDGIPMLVRHAQKG